MTKGSGRPKVTLKSEDKLIRIASLRNRRLTAPELRAELNTMRSSDVSTSTVQRWLRDAGLKEIIAARKPFSRPINEKRLAWAKKHKLKSGNQCCGQTSLNLKYLAQMAECLWDAAKVNAWVLHVSFPLWNMEGTVLWSGDVLLVTCCDNRCKSPTTMNLCWNGMPLQYLEPSEMRLVGRSFFQQDNDPKHTSKLCKNHLLQKENAGQLKIMTWPPQSTCLNPIEIVWDELDRRVKAKQTMSALHLWKLLQDNW